MEEKEFRKLGGIADELSMLMLDTHKLSSEGCKKVCDLLITKFEDWDEEYDDQEIQSEDESGDTNV